MKIKLQEVSVYWYLLTARDSPMWRVDSNDVDIVLDSSPHSTNRLSFWNDDIYIWFNTNPSRIDIRAKCGGDERAQTSSRQPPQRSHESFFDFEYKVSKLMFAIWKSEIVKPGANANGASASATASTQLIANVALQRQTDRQTWNEKIRSQTEFSINLADVERLTAPASAAILTSNYYFFRKRTTQTKVKLRAKARRRHRTSDETRSLAERLALVTIRASPSTTLKLLFCLFVLFSVFSTHRNKRSNFL